MEGSSSVPTDEIPQADDDDLFYFESDHLALRGNKDYSEMLKTLVTLTSIRERAIKDYETVVKIHKDCTQDPDAFIEKLQKGEPLGIPDRIHIPEIPVIDWTKYNIDLPEKFLSDIANEGHVSSRKKLEEAKPKITHSKPWTTEEQKRLEELLVTYPPEEIELRRFKKIAAALGNRTVPQVCSRIQKYFQKLYKAGLPIPGRIPKNLYSKKKAHKHQKHNHYLWKPSTFFPELDIPVVMNEEDVPGPSHASSSQDIANDQHNYLLPNNYHQEERMNVPDKSEKESLLDILRKVKYEKQRETMTNSEPFIHIGFKCDFCNEEPIQGSRWHCSTCLNNSIDFCTDCMISQLYSNNTHPLSHSFIVVRDNNFNSGTISSESSDESEDDQIEAKQFSDNEDSNEETFDNAEASTKQNKIYENIEDDLEYDTEDLCADIEIKTETVEPSCSYVNTSDIVMKCEEDDSCLLPVFKSEDFGTALSNVRTSDFNQFQEDMYQSD